MGVCFALAEESLQLHHRTSGADVPRGVRCQNLKIEYQVCVANLEAKHMRRRMKTTWEVAAWGEKAGATATA